MSLNTITNPWVSFCMSTYKRPQLLKTQLHIISQQTFTNFEVIISDNDPENSARKIVDDLNDQRFKYFSNGENIGMIPGFNLSIERSIADYVVMITDDDPVQVNFLSDIFEIYTRNKGYGIYAGFLRKKKSADKIELIDGDRFPEEILNPAKTEKILWSSCIIEKNIVFKIGKIPDYGSPHLADHALIVMAGSISGGVVINKMYSRLSSHETNFSKSNFLTYKTGCAGFYATLTYFFKSHPRFKYIKKSIDKHLKSWVITNIFALKKYYTLHKNIHVLSEIDITAKNIFCLHFMQHFKLNYYSKNLIFYIKKNLKIL